MFYPPILLANVWQFVFGILMFLTSVFLILLVLVQRGRGGGLAGAFGGMGGQSAFGTKAGDLFTRITIGAAVVWILLCICAIKMLNHDTSVFGAARPDGPSLLEASSEPAASGTAAEAEGAAASLPAAAGGGLDAGAGAEDSSETDSSSSGEQ